IGNIYRWFILNAIGCVTTPWISSRGFAGSMSGGPAWWRSKTRPFGVIMPLWCCNGVMLQSDQFWRFFRTSLRRRATCASYFAGTPYMASGIGRPGSCALGGTLSGAAPAPAATAPPVNAAVLRKKSLRLEILAMGPPPVWRVQYALRRSGMSTQPVHDERARQRVVHVAAVQQLAAVRVIDRLLAENVAGALGDAALHLSFDDLVVDDVAGVVAGDVADDLGDAGFHLDLDLGDVAAVGERRPDLLFLQVHVEPAGMLAGQRRQRDLAVGALDAVFALQELDVGRRGLQFLRRERETFPR